MINTATTRAINALPHADILSIEIDLDTVLSVDEALALGVATERNA